MWMLVSKKASINVAGANGSCRINELVRGVNFALNIARLDACPEFDCNGDGRITVDCLVQAVNAALHGCAG